MSVQNYSGRGGDDYQEDGVELEPGGGEGAGEEVLREGLLQEGSREEGREEGGPCEEGGSREEGGCGEEAGCQESEEVRRGRSTAPGAPALETGALFLL